MLMSMSSCNRSFLGFFLDVCYAAFFHRELFVPVWILYNARFFLDVGVLRFIVLF